ncbi:MAG: methionyl-tRNA formyltransferase [bacterium]
MKIILFSTSDNFIGSIPECLLEKNHELPAIVTAKISCKEKDFLKEKGVEIINISGMDSEMFVEKLKKYNPDLFVVVSFGRIFTKEFLKIPKIGAVNIHFSLLPRYRGPAPIEWAVFNGEKITGVTVFFINEKVDSGDIIIQRKFEIGALESAEHLYGRLSGAACGILCEALEFIQDKSFSPRAQEGCASAAPLIKKENGRVDFKTEASSRIFRKVIAFSGRINVFAFFGRQRLIIREAKEVPDCGRSLPGSVCKLLKGEGFVVKCGQGSLLVTKVKPEGKREMSGWEFAIGRRIKEGSLFC